MGLPILYYIFLWPLFRPFQTTIILFILNKPFRYYRTFYDKMSRPQRQDWKIIQPTKARSKEYPTSYGKI